MPLACVRCGVRPVTDAKTIVERSDLHLRAGLAGGDDALRRQVEFVRRWFHAYRNDWCDACATKAASSEEVSHA